MHLERGELTAFGNAVVIGQNLSSSDGKKIAAVIHIWKHEIFKSKKNKTIPLLRFFTDVKNSFRLLMFLCIFH